MIGNNDYISETQSQEQFEERTAQLHLGEGDVPLMELNRTPIVVFMQGTIRYVNTALASLFSASRDTFVDASVDVIFQSRCLEQMHCWMSSPSLSNGENLMLDIQMTPGDAAPRWFNANFVATTWNGSPAIAGFLSDIEGKKKNKAVEQQLRQSQKMEALGRLAGGVAHDMNNTLGAIMGFASVLHAEMDPDSRAMQDLNQILKACRKGKNLMLNLLGFARRGKYRRENFSVSTIVDEAADLLAHSIPKKIVISHKIEQPDIEVYGDPTQIQHALMNICINAVDSMGDSGHLSVHVQKKEITHRDDSDGGHSEIAELEEGEYVEIRVSDTGRGMDPEVINMAFEPFFTTKPLGEGSGLGLPMVYGTVKNHGGAVILESTPNEGTSVTLLLPISKYISQDTSISMERKSSSSSPTPTVLLVDDEEMIRLAGKRILEKMGYKVLLASDGMEGIRVFSEHKEKLSVVILDMMMPVMDGEETFLRLREISADVPILLSSGYSKEEKAEQLLTKGADAFIQKPFDMKSLQSSLQHLLADESEPASGPH